jgi:hypothetical protein
MESPPRLGSGVPADVIHQNSAHHARRHGEKVNPILPVHRVAPHQPEIGLVDQGCALQSVVLALLGETSSGNAAEFFVDQDNQGLACRGLSPIPARQQNGDLVGRIGRQASPRVRRHGIGRKKYPGFARKSMHSEDLIRQSGVRRAPAQSAGKKILFFLSQSRCFFRFVDEGRVWAAFRGSRPWTLILISADLAQEGKCDSPEK